FDSEFGTAFGRLHAEVDESVRDSLFMLRYHAENYVSHLSYERLGEARDRRKPPPGLTRYWRIPRRSDNCLAARLFGVEDHTKITREQMRMFLSLFVGHERERSRDEPTTFDAIRDLLRAAVTAGPAGMRIGDVRQALDTLLTSVEDTEEGENRLG